jgi:peptidoglycan/xylan/chitin deacetylase (PgdA/CDA1 family)
MQKTGMESSVNPRPNRRFVRSAQVGAVAAVALVLAAAGLWALGRAQQGRPVPVLMYHNLGVAPGDDVWTVDVREFERHLSSLREQGYRSILPADLVAAARWGRPLPRKPVIITFDDGLLSVMKLGEPLLAKYGFHAIAYIITDLPAAAGEPHKNYRDDPALTWPEINAMVRRGTITIGSHSHSHSQRPATNAAEAPRSRQLIGDHAGSRTGDFCYPYGADPPELVNAVRKEGFSSAVICEDEVAFFRSDMDLLRIPRVSVFGGVHRFSVKPVASADGDIVFEGRNDGLPIPVLPVLRAGDRTFAREGPQLPRLGSDPQRWRWPRAAATLGAGESLRVELWDRHRVLRLYP